MSGSTDIRGFSIAGREIGPGRPVFIMAEVAQAHDGSLGMAHAFIDAIARAGADAVKFQTHIAEAESTAREPFRVAFSRQDATRFDYWKRTSFTEPQWKGLADHARERGLVFLSSPFSIEALEWLERAGAPAWKVGAGEVGNTPLIDRMLATGKPILLSSGMTSWAELDALAAKIRAAGSPLMIYQCTTRYPCPPADVGLGLIAAMRERYRVPVGLSDHSGTICFGIAAAALGAASVEIHLAISRESFGPDVPASLVPAELAEMVRGIRAVEESLRSTPDKDEVAARLAEAKRIFGRSIVARAAIPPSTVLTAAHLALKKPGGGLPPSMWDAVVGRRTRRALAADDLVTEEDLHP